MDTFSKMIVSFSKVFGGSQGSLRDFPANGVAPAIVLEVDGTAFGGAALGGAALAALITGFLAPEMALPGLTNLDATTMDAQGGNGNTAESR